MLVHPSLPSPSGIAWLLWPWVKPKIYDHLEWRPGDYDDNLTAKTTRRVFFVALLITNATNKNNTTDTKDEFATGTKLLQVHKVRTVLRNPYLFTFSIYRNPLRCPDMWRNASS
jgi:hypothetical protein